FESLWLWLLHMSQSRNITVHSSQLVCSLPGPQGPAGNPGAPGSTGTMGPMGAPGQDGLDGKDGDKGVKGERGESLLLYLTGTRGQKGDVGDRGEEGAPGGCNCGKAARSAFSVAVTQSYPKERLPIRFSRILLNEGNHYNASSGKFVCAIPGVYYFTYDITLANKHLAIGLVHNGQYKIKTFDANTGNHDVASGSTVLHLQRADQVWLQIFYSEQNGLFFDPFWTDSTFTGFLIFWPSHWCNSVLFSLSTLQLC
uniref:C1q and TNF related 2 n=1 Tax=Myripristis murdjan TaxID=586833 RepID=A0A667Z0F3_9TELE